MGRIICLGDEHQCQPAGTLVDVVLRNGNRWKGMQLEKVPIEKLSVGDKVVSLRKQERQWTRSRKITNISKRYYQGNLIVVRGGGMVSRYTPNHKCLVSFSDLRDKWCLYLMRKENFFRLGKAKMDYGRIGSGLVARMGAEGADSAWILSIHESDYDAKVQEIIVSYKFGIPQLKFCANNKSVFTEQDLAYIWKNIGNNRKQGEECLAFFGRDPNYPLFRGERDYKKSVKRSMWAQACNIVNGCKMLPYTHGSDPIGRTKFRDKVIVKTADYISVEVEREYYEGFVYSLEVERDETYVADGFVTHNSIYGFRGSDIAAFESFHEMLQSRPNGCREFPLSVCRRCPKSHIRLAQTLVPDIKWMTVENSGVEAPEGEIYQVSLNVALDMMKEGDMGVGRVNKVLIPAAYQLIRMRKKVIIRGRDIGTGLISLIKKMKATSVENLLFKLQKWFDKEVGKLCAKEGVDNPALLQKGMTKYQSLEDKVCCIEALCDGIETLDELIVTIEKLFSDFDDSGKPKQAIVLGTVHRTKGLEAHNVTVLDPENFPHALARKNWERDQERNLSYVCCTRSKFSLTGDGSVIEPGRLIFVGSCPSIYKANWLNGLNKYPDDGKQWEPKFRRDNPQPLSEEDKRHEAMMRAIKEANL